MNTIGGMGVTLGLNYRGFDTGMMAVHSRINAVSEGFGGLARAAAGMAGIVGVGTAITKAFTGFADMESNQVAFETLLGSGTRAKRMMEDLSKFGAETPFQLPELTKAAKNLAAFGMEADGIVPKLRQIGDISSLLGQPITEMATLFGKAKVAGVLMSEDINQFTERGVPLIQQLAKQFGVAEVMVKKLASEGKVSFSHLETAINSLTSSGGRFAGGMEKQSQTLKGLWSTLSDNVGMALTHIGENMVETFSMKEALGGVIKFTDSFKGYITEAFTAVRFVYDNFLDLTASIFGRAGLKVFTFGADMVHVFTHNIPEALAYLAENWKGVWNNIGAFMDHWLAKAKQGLDKYLGEFDLGLAQILEDVGLADKGHARRHFDKLVADNAARIPPAPPVFQMLPQLELSKRGLSDAERGFAANLDAIDQRLAVARDKAIAPKVTQGTFLTDWFQDLIKKSPGGAGGMAAEVSKRQETRYAGAIESGTKEAYNVIMRSRDLGVKPAQQTADNTKEMVVQQKKVVNKLDEVITGMGGNLNFAGFANLGEG